MKGIGWVGGMLLSVGAGVAIAWAVLGGLPAASSHPEGRRAPRPIVAAPSLLPSGSARPSPAAPVGSLFAASTVAVPGRHLYPKGLDERLLAAAPSVVLGGLPAPERSAGPLPAGVLRSRKVRLDLPALRRAAEAAGTPSPESAFRLDLFHGASALILLRKAEREADGTAQVWGGIPGQPDSQFVGVLDANGLTAMLSSPETPAYAIRGIADGAHEIWEMDPAALSACGLDAGAGTGFGGGSVLAAAPAVAATTVIDIMVAYTPAARLQMGGVAQIESAIRLAAAIGNGVYQNSLVPVRLRIVRMLEASYTETGDPDSDLFYLASGSIPGVVAGRNASGADMVCLVVDRLGAYSGYTVLNPSLSASNAYSLVTTGALFSYTFIHELTHQLGCVHEDRSITYPAAYPYAYGYRAPSGLYGDVMSAPLGYRAPYISSPDVIYAGAPIGIPDQADCARAVRQAAPVAAAWRSAVAVTADAGLDLCVIDADGDGWETVALDGSGSGAPGAFSCEWSEAGRILGTSAAIQADLAAGERWITLTVRSGSTTVSDVVRVLVLAGPGIVVPDQFGTIQAAVDAAPPGGIVWVRPGVYTGPGNFDITPRGKPVQIRSMEGAYATVVDCGADVGHPHRGFQLVSGEGPACVLEGFTVTGGYSSGYGGGILCAHSSPILRDNLVLANTANYSGGGISCDGGAPVLEGNVVMDNRLAQSSGTGGGIRCGTGGTLLVRANRISGNEAELGGGIYLTGGAFCRVESCLLTGNRSTYAGGAILGESSATLELVSCTIADNVSSGYGGAVGVYNASASIVNSILWRNSTAPGGEIWQQGGSLSAHHCTIQGGRRGIGNLSSDPLLEADCRLGAGSPCIDSADGDEAPAMDAEGMPRVDDPDVQNTGTGAVPYADRGAYERRTRLVWTVEYPIDPGPGPVLPLEPVSDGPALEAAE